MVKPVGQDLLWTGPESGDVLIVGWGSTFGAIKAATIDLQKEGLSVAACHVLPSTDTRSSLAASAGSARNAA